MGRVGESPRSSHRASASKRNNPPLRRRRLNNAELGLNRGHNETLDALFKHGSKCRDRLSCTKASINKHRETMEIVGNEHWVTGKSAHDGSPLRLYVWEKSPERDPTEFSQSGKIVLLVHGSRRSGRVAFDLPVETVPGEFTYSFMDSLAYAGYDVFSLDAQCYGRSDHHPSGLAVRRKSWPAILPPLWNTFARSGARRGSKLSAGPGERPLQRSMRRNTRTVFTNSRSTEGALVGLTLQMEAPSQSRWMRTTASIPPLSRP